MRIWLIFVALLLPSFLLAGPVRAVATSTFVADLVRSVGGEDVEVVGLIPHGVDPHMFKPTIADVNHLMRADVVFFNGLGLEGRMADVLRRLERRGTRAVAVAESIPTEYLLQDEDNPNQADPHIWFDPRLWARAVDSVVRVLSELDASNAEHFTARGEALSASYESLHEWAAASLAKIPPERRILITSHDAFQYFGRAYDLEVIGVQGISTVGEAGLSDITRIVDRVRGQSIPAVFVETSVSSAAVRRISQDSGVRIGGSLYSDSTGTPGEVLHSPTGMRYDPSTYTGAFRHNVLTIVDALGL
ncbi:MAG: zinc ABC transporter substrate-binding protein [Opitutales bacterium]|nr:zinc ABC transporter substrate-binding protein [Opitutales bacterium]